MYTLFFRHKMQVNTKIRVVVTVQSYFSFYEVCIIHAELILSLKKIVLNNHNSRIKKWHIYILLDGKLLFEYGPSFYEW